METLLGFSIEARAKKRCEMHLPGRYVDFRIFFPPLLQQEFAIGFPIRFSFRTVLSCIGDYLFNWATVFGAGTVTQSLLAIYRMLFSAGNVAADLENLLQEIVNPARVEEILTYRTLSCSKAKPYWKPYWDFPDRSKGKKKM